jgi:site-specific DNA recombinase
MYVPSNTPKYVCYECRNKIPVGDLEGVFHEQLKHFFFSPEDITEYLHHADHVLKEKEALLHTFESEQGKVVQEMDRVYRLYVDDKITADAFSERYRPLEDRRNQLRDEIPRLQGELDFLKIQYLSSDEIVEKARDLYSRWDGLLPEEKRHVVETITERITIEDEVEIHLCYLPDPVEMMARRQHGHRGSWT